MLVHRKKRPRYQIQAPLTSLIDIVFMLLIYFLLTTNFMVDEGIKIKLPQARASAPQITEEITVYMPPTLLHISHETSKRMSALFVISLGMLFLDCFFLNKFHTIEKEKHI